MTEFAPQLGSALENLRLERALLDLLDALSPIKSVSFKGPLLTRLVYGDLSGRTSSDNDVLVHPDDWARALDALCRRGYRFYLGPEPEDVRQDPRALLVRDEVELYPPQGKEQVVVDLHKAAFSKLHFAADERVVWENLSRVQLHGREVVTFSPELAFVQLVAHAVSHWLDARTVRDVEQAWPRLRDRLDFLRVADIASRTVSLRTLEIVLRVATANLEGDLSGAWPSDPAARRVARLLLHALPRGGSVLPRAALVSLFVVPSDRAASLLRRSVLPRRDELLERFGSGSTLKLWGRHIADLASKLR